MKKYDYIRISSAGKIEVDAFSLIGASSKRDDTTKIGFFGSGLKYSIAFLLRNNIPFRVFSGYEEIIFGTETTSFRDKDFQRILVNGNPTSLTTEMGIQWEGWQIIREIYSNSIDEGEQEIKLVKENQVLPQEDRTTFFISITPDFQTVIDNWGNYFSEGREAPIYLKHNIAIYNANNLDSLWYRKGIRCYDYANTKPLFHYDLPDIAINESRVASSTYSAEYSICSRLRSCDNLAVIQQIIIGINEAWERCLDWHYAGYDPLWYDALEGCWVVPYENAGHWAEEIEILKGKAVIIPHKMIEGLRKVIPEGKTLNIIGEKDNNKTDGKFKYITDISPKIHFYIEDAKQFLTKAGYSVDYPIHVVSFAKKNINGQAFDGKILLSELLFDKGKKKIIQVILEENEHLITELSDETRDFQDRLFELLVTSFEKTTGIYL